MFTSECEPGESLSLPVKHSFGRWYAPEDQLDDLERNGQLVLRYAPGQNPNGSARDVAGVTNEQGNVLGLMPHPEHAVDELNGSADACAPVRLARRDAPRALPRAGVTQVAEAQALGLTAAELGRIIDLLGREPNRVELAVFSLLWSEHCAYKHSKKLLRKLPTEGPRVLMGPGENAGAVDAGDGLAVVFKVESHNHPSAVEPFQGAATGVGGILRDIFALGARPIAVLDSLRFGDISTPRTRYLLERVVAGIGAYGNSVGVPTVGGEIYFEPPYEQNCLVNAMCVGLAPADGLIRSAAAGPGNVLVLIGALTGRDGIGGASVLASAELGEGEEDKRPTVQIGDPFEESRLIECCLELVASELLVALQDLGAAGLSSSTSEMAAKGDVGLDVDVSRVPLREQDMEPFEVMISESQERMLCVVEPSRLDDVLALCRRWEVRATAIGEVTDTRRLRVFDGDEMVGDMPVSALVDECPLYDLEPEEPPDRLAAFAAPRPRLDPDAGEQEAFRAVLVVGERLQPPAGVRAVRLPGRQPHRAPARAGGCGRPAAGARRARRPTARSPCRSTATGGGSRAIPTSAPPRRCASAPRTWRAWAPSHSASPTASTSATPRSLTSRGS